MERDLTNIKKDKDFLEQLIALSIKDFVRKYQGIQFEVEIEQKWEEAGWDNDAFMTSLRVDLKIIS